MVDPIVIGGAAAVAIVAIAAAYAAYSGEEADVEVSDEGVSAEFGDNVVTEELEVQTTEDVPSLDDVFVHDDLTTIDGVGEATAENLSAAGFVTVEDVAAAPITALVEADGVGEKRAGNLAMNAAAALNETE